MIIATVTQFLATKDDAKVRAFVRSSNRAVAGRKAELSDAARTYAKNLLYC